jgi:hypothetical protein
MAQMGRWSGEKKRTEILSGDYLRFRLVGRTHLPNQAFWDNLLVYLDNTGRKPCRSFRTFILHVETHPSYRPTIISITYHLSLDSAYYKSHNIINRLVGEFAVHEVEIHETL